MEDIKYLHIISDIHLEFKKNKYPKLCPFKAEQSYLALLGDIGYPSYDNYKNFIDYHSKIFKHIFIISGNHEYYTIESIEIQISNITNLYDNVTYLQKSYIQIGNTLFLGCTLWTEIKDSTLVEISMNDYSNIYISNNESMSNDKSISNDRSMSNDKSMSNKISKYDLGYVKRRKIHANKEKLKPYHILSYHTEMKEWIFKTIDENLDKNIIVLTHHTPSYEMLDHKDDPLSQCYASDLDSYIKKYNNLDYWICGHTHLCKEINIGNTICISNCMGYNNEKIQNFNINKYITFV